ncbi:GNAT family N-acetyltransferase [Paenibacillus sp. CAU 1523]|uniref:GNAT family N-acetyltransferase n=2 Tax=Paenibacillus arenosi TaxID=2774142 RepID=A0ABR9AZB9_9BACL|nr:GNAT family N-acetyltransferase [Paenibacillus arenosi]MBD8498545.1 GNAT family N-acetyltransferase [Paenibacillus arenosi]
MPALGELYNAIVAEGDPDSFWWIGNEHNWSNVFCAFEDGKMVAKGQVSIITTLPAGRPSHSKHSIYVNLRTLPQREHDYALLDKVYPYLYTKALELKATLPKEYGTHLCIGNPTSEVANNQYFIQKGFHYLYSSFGMSRDLQEPIPLFPLPKPFQFSHWKMESSQEEQHYLDIEGEIWPDAPLRSDKLTEYKNYPLWTAIVVREADTIVGSLMAWQDGSNKDTVDGIIEDVFIREQWRNLGLAKYLLAQGLNYLKAHGLKTAYLEVLTTNKAALTLYESVGFYQTSEEVRHYIELK